MKLGKLKASMLVVATISLVQGMVLKMKVEP